MLKIINSCLLLSFLLQLASSLALIFSLGGKLGEISYTVHTENGKIFLVLAACHIYLNRNWIVHVLFKKRRTI